MPKFPISIVSFHTQKRWMMKIPVSFQTSQKKITLIQNVKKFSGKLNRRQFRNVKPTQQQGKATFKLEHDLERKEI